MAGTDGRVKKCAGCRSITALRQEDIGVAGVPRPVSVQIVDHANERRDLVFLLSASSHACGLALIVIPADPAAHDQAQRLGQAQAQVAVNAITLVAVVGAAPGRTRRFSNRVVIGIEDVQRPIAVDGGIARITFLLRPVAADGQLVGQAKGVETTVQMAVETVALQRVRAKQGSDQS